VPGQNYIPDTLPFESTPVPIKHEAGWAAAPGWILQTRRKYFFFARIQTPHQPAQNLVTVLITQFWLNVAGY